jgi:serine/threonine-protein kinase
VNVSVPNVTGGTQAQAQSALSNLELNASITSEHSDRVAAGTVLSQSPAAGSKVNAGTAVAVKVSLGATAVQVTVPNVTGGTQAQAESALGELGVIARITSENSATVAAGTVISQSPSAGSKVNAGTAVAVKVSLGAAVVQVTIPNLVGYTQAQAEGALGDLGLNANITSENSATVAAGTVISQSPAAGSKVNEGTTVAVMVSLGAAVVQVTIPNLVGNTQAQAESALSDLGLNADITRESSDSVATGAVISQSPAAGAKAEQGATVSIRVSSGAATVAVPNVVGMSRSDALSSLETAGLSGSVSGEQFSDSVAAGNVLSQSVAAGGSATRGAVVNFVIS